MDEEEREELLYRIDERTNTLVKDLARVSRDIADRLDRVLMHQERQNRGIESALILATSNKTSIKWIKGIGALLISSVLAVIGFFIKIFQS